jgi:hypothetical protein
MMQVALTTIGILLVLAVVQFVYFAFVMAWSDQQTNDGRYYARPRHERASFRAQIRRHTLLLEPCFWLLSHLRDLKLQDGEFHYQGVPGPKGACDEASFARGANYVPRTEDVFIVTQMKCGTTWMQNLVYQLVTRGQNELTESGAALYAVSPWLESRKTLPVDQAPLLGQARPTRIIKTHFPVSLCPYDTSARYIYVVRHPVSCFASCADFLRSNLHRFAPPLATCEAWFCSPQTMWWSTWPEHVAGWWHRAQQADNVLFVRFEDMKRDLRAIARQVETLLGLAPLDDQRLGEVLERCSFEWMSENYDLFEMQVPHLLQDAPGFFKSGSGERHEDVPPEMAQRIVAWCREELRRAGLPSGQLYDLP